MARESIVGELREKAKRWQDANPGLHSDEVNYGSVMTRAADTIEAITSVKWMRIGGRKKPKTLTPIWVCNSSWIHPLVAFKTLSGEFTTDGHNSFMPEYWAEIEVPPMPKDVLQEDSEE